MDSKAPKNLEQLLGHLDRAVPPVAPTNHTTAASTSNGVRPDTDPSREMAAMVNAARRLAHGPKPMLSEAALDRIEARLRAQHAVLQDGTTRPFAISATRPAALSQARSSARPSHPSSSRARRLAQAGWHGATRTLRYAAAVMLIMVLLTSGLAAASASSVPNDELYIVKLGFEELRLGLVSEESEPDLRVNFAGRRLDEFETLLARQIIYPKVLEEASAQMNRALTLLAAGYGNRQKLDAQIAALTYQQGQLIQEAAMIAQPADYARLHVVSTWNNALFVRVVAEGTAHTTGSVLASGQTPPPILPEAQILPDILSGPTDDDATPGSPDDGMVATPSDNTADGDKPGADADKDTNKDKDKDKDNNGKGNTGNTGQGNTGNTGQGGHQGQGNSGNTNQGNSGNAGQGNAGSGQGNSGSTDQGNSGNAGQGNPGNAGQDKDKDNKPKK